MAQIKVLALGDRLFAPHVNFLFASKKQTIGLDAPLLVDDCNGDGVDMQSLIQRAANERFHRELELSEAELYVSTAETLMPKAPIALTDKVIVKEVEPSTAVLTCWLHVELPVIIAALAPDARRGQNERARSDGLGVRLEDDARRRGRRARLLAKEERLHVPVVA